MNNEEILFASLVGSKLVKTAGRLSVVENELGKHVLPGLPISVKTSPTSVNSSAIGSSFSNLWKQDVPLSEEQQFFPLSFSLTENGDRWLFPYEPMISISGKNNIVKRNVAKWKPNDTNTKDNFFGTIKERWSMGDYEITITGVLLGAFLKGEMEDCFPIDDFLKLKNFLTHTKEIYVWCEPFNLLGINKVVIEDFSFPFTKGENVQAYEIRCTSDSSYKLLIEE